MRAKVLVHKAAGGGVALRSHGSLLALRLIKDTTVEIPDFFWSQEGYRKPEIFPHSVFADNTFEHVVHTIALFIKMREVGTSHSQQDKGDLCNAKN
jgi:hypothetical protein